MDWEDDLPKNHGGIPVMPVRQRKTQTPTPIMGGCGGDLRILSVAQGRDSVLEAAPSGGPGFRRILRRNVYARSGQF